MATNNQNTPEENYPRRPGKQPMENPDIEERSESTDSRGPPPQPRDEDMYYNPERYVPIIELENRQLKQLLAEANKRNEELTRIAAEAQVAQPPPPRENQVPPPRDVHVPPWRPCGRPRKDAATRRPTQPLASAEPSAPPRPQRST